jgi:murein DD-endopeptidase MepM/ murein hydrolase activator NlpD
MVYSLRISVFLLLLSLLSSAQNDYPQHIFREPMDLPLELSGSFSELRQVNFHAGIDIRVLNRTNRNVYSIGNGYVSRIKVEPSGYGNALYIAHPEGYVSVYAHLDRFNKEIAHMVKRIQYEKQSFSIDINFPPDSLKISKNDFIGIAGNTGYSFGAHLHFEIRDAETEEIIDPLLFGLKVRDSQPPQFKEMKLYAHGTSTINNKNSDLILKTNMQTNGVYSIASIPSASGAISFGFDILDKQNTTNPNRLGLKTIKVFIDDSLFLDISFSRLNFSSVRHQLAYIDIPERKKTGKRFQQTWKKPGNNLPIYNFIRDEGILYINENKTYRVNCIIEDIGNNKAELQFRIKGAISEHLFEMNCDEGYELFYWDTLNIWSGKFSEIVFDKGTLFSDECLLINESDSSGNTIHPVLHIFNENELSGFYKIRMKAHLSTEEVTDLTIAKSTGKGKYSGLRTTFTDGYFEAYSRSFGTFLLMRDTIPPKIEPEKIPANGAVTSLKKLTFKVTDDICGIDSYNAYINGEWVLLEYDLKSDQMFYVMDEKMPAGKSAFKIVVTDFCGNIGIWEKTLIR